MIDDKTQRIVGSWVGTSTLWLEPGAPVRECASTLTAHTVSLGEFLTLEYTWSFDGRPAAGALTIGWDPKKQRWQAAWTDSWHLSAVLMSFTGTDADAIDVRGEYEIEGHPNWGWRIAVEVGDDALVVRMWNIEPGGTEYPAVEGRYARG